MMHASTKKRDPASDKKSKKDMRRVFIAVHLPDPVIKTLAGIQQDLRQCGLQIRWTRPETIHLTLKFLGDVPAESIEALCDAVKTGVGDLAAFQLAAKGVGVFPGVRRPRVVWTGLSGQTDALERLHHAIDSAIFEMGFAKDDRRFTGHLTLGRFTGQSDPEALIDILKAFADKASDSFEADAVHVMQSDLKPSGPVYTVLSSIRLSSWGVNREPQKIN
ncbi:MAG: RNA 2',3'-cyclic phosphodiesterase [Desulfobacterales bacterium CG23_combo_of_CG06-09_8_20_14_all_51_8]|nr:MAG: RNA 2',3'-cyclic phosphodiesterase [Desulfobacterales bacterium CG23_combo_of_CG06-09_8_20_14_all_51_8]